MTTTRTIDVEIKCPMLPNFISVGDEMVSIADFTDTELQSIGEDWTKELIKKAHQKRTV